MLPPFTAEGVLPPGIHAAAWPEIEERFGRSPRRRDLLDGLRRALRDLRAAGCRRVYLNGSFVTAKEDPNDYDLCWEEEGINFDLLPAVLLSAVGDRPTMQAAYGGDIFPIGFQPGLAGWRMLELFQLRKHAFGFKGIISIDLEDHA